MLSVATQPFCQPMILKTDTSQTLALLTRQDPCNRRKWINSPERIVIQDCISLLLMVGSKSLVLRSQIIWNGQFNPNKERKFPKFSLVMKIINQAGYTRVRRKEIKVILQSSRRKICTISTKSQIKNWTLCTISQMNPPKIHFKTRTKKNLAKMKRITTNP